MKANPSTIRTVNDSGIYPDAKPVIVLIPCDIQ